MDNKTIFFRTSKGEDEVHSRTTHLPGDIKRALLMVDGNANFGEISRRAAPSLRTSLDEMMQELEKGGFIQERAQEKTAQDKARNDNIPKMAVPQKRQPVADDGELNFMGGFNVRSPEKPAADQSEKLRDEADDKSLREMAAAKFSAQLEAEAILHKAEQEAARIREETVRRAKAEAEATRLNAELEARKVRDELAAAKLKAEQEARLRLEEAAKVRQQAEAARIKAEQEAEQMRIELDAAKIRAEVEARIRLDATAQAHARIQAEDDAAKSREDAERISRQGQEAGREREEKERIERQEREAARVREEAERVAKHEQRVREETERIIRQEQEATRAREEAERMAKQDQRVREETERIIRQEQETARAREEAERIVKHEQRVREETERIIRREQEAARAREVSASEQAARISEAPAEKPSPFSFDSFQVDQPLYTSESHIEKRPAQQANRSQQASRAQQPGPAQQGRPAQQPGPAQQPAAARTDRPAEGRRPEKQQPVPPPVASKPFTDGKPNQEQIRRATQERIAVEKRMAAEALEAKKMAEAQAKVWAEAEKRALEVARAEVEQATKQVSFTIADAPSAKSVPIVRARRKSFSWGKMGGLLFKLGVLLLILLVCVLFVIPYVVPMRDYMPKAEQLLSAKLQQKVHIGRLSGRILPTPRLEVGEIYIGDAKQFQADNAQINFAFMGVLTDEKPVNSIEFQGVKVRGAWLRNVSEWLQKMANEEKYPVSRIVISQGTLDADAVQLTGIEGTLDFDPAGKFTQSNLRANAGKYNLVINSTPPGKLQAAITVRGSALPLLPNWTFDDLNAKGEITNNELVISDFNGRIFGGVMQGNAIINWHSGWRTQGVLTAKTINMQNLSKLLDGKVDGSAHFKMTSQDLGGLADSVSLEGSFTSKDGTISGMDIVETARKRSKENLPGGRTHYDGLAGVVSYTDGVYHFKQTKITTPALISTATFDVDAANQQLSGKMNVNLSLKDTGGSVDLQIGGVADSPTLRYAQ
jgi:hypothetical protein